MPLVLSLVKLNGSMSRSAPYSQLLSTPGITHMPEFIQNVKVGVCYTLNTSPNADGRFIVKITKRGGDTYDIETFPTTKLVCDVNNPLSCVTYDSEVLDCCKFGVPTSYTGLTFGEWKPLAGDVYVILADRQSVVSYQTLHNGIDAATLDELYDDLKVKIPGVLIAVNSSARQCDGTAQIRPELEADDDGKFTYTITIAAKASRTAIMEAINDATVLKSTTTLKTKKEGTTQIIVGVSMASSIGILSVLVMGFAFYLKTKKTTARRRDTSFLNPF